MAVTLERVLAEIKQQAVLLEDVPNSALEDVDQLRSFFDSELRFAIDQAIDAHVIAAFTAASPPAGGAISDMIATVRAEIATMRAAGFAANVLCVSPDDAVDLHLAQQPGTSADYVFPVRDSGSSSPLFGLTIVESPTITGNPLLLDTRQVGVLYLGALRLDANPWLKFASNLTDLRAELKSLMVVRRPAAAMFLTGTSQRARRGPAGSVA